MKKHVITSGMSLSLATFAGIFSGVAIQRYGLGLALVLETIVISYNFR